MRLIRQNSFSGKRIKAQGSKFFFKISLFAGTLMVSGVLFSKMVSSKPNEKNTFENGVPFVEKEVVLYALEEQPEEKIVEVFEPTVPSVSEEREKTIEELFSYYGKVFQIDVEMAYERARELTGDFKNPEYLKTYTIGDTTVYNEKRDWSNYKRGQEIGILAFMRDLRVEALKFGLNQESVKKTQAIEESSIYDLVVSFSEIFSVDPYIIYSIMSLECGADFSSNAAVSYHNYAGLMNGKTDSLYVYPTKDFGVLEAILNFKLKYADVWEQEDTVQRKVEKLQEMYAPLNAKNDPTSLNQYWTQNVLSFYYTFKEQGLFEKETDLLVHNHR